MRNPNYKFAHKASAVKRRVLCVLAAILCVNLITIASAHAGSLMVSPVRIFFEKGQTITSIRVQNQGDDPILVQSELVSWLQEENLPVYESTEDLIISPPIFELGGQQSQTVRLALRDGAIPDQEKTYRVFLTEVPVSDSAKSGGVQLKVALRLALPIFVAPDTNHRDLRFSLHRNCQNPDQADTWVFAAKNQGSRHDRVLGFELIDENKGEKVFSSGVTRYVLADSTIRWELDELAASLPEKLRAKIKYYPLRSEEVELPVDALGCEHRESLASRF